MSRKIFVLALVCLVLGAFSCARKGEEPVHVFKTAYDKLAEDSIGNAYVLAQKALDGFRRSGDVSGEERTKVFIAMLYYITDQNDDAVRMLEEVGGSSVEMLDTVGLQNLLRLRSHYAARSGRADEALGYVDSLIEVDLRFGNTRSWVLDRLNKAEILIGLGRIDWARRLVDSISPEEAAEGIVAPIWHARKAQLAFDGDDLDGAREHAEESLRLANPEATDIESRLMARSILMRIDSLRGNLAGYAENRNLLQTAQDRVRGEQVKNHMAILEATETVERLRLENEYQNHKFIYIMMLCTLVIVLVVVVAVWKYNSIVTKHKIVKLTCDSLDLEVFRYKMKNDLLSEKVKTLSDKIADVHDQLVRMHSDGASDPQGSDDETYLDRLKRMLAENHGEAMRRVRAKYPKLSPNEELLIGFVKMGLTTSEIARALNIEPRSLIKARYRLRKKLGIANSDELNDFIREI